MIQIGKSYFLKDYKKAIENLKDSWAAISRDEKYFLTSSKVISIKSIEKYKNGLYESFNVHFKNECGEEYRNSYTKCWLEEYLVEYKIAKQEEMDI